MPRRPRQLTDSGIYHIITRGNNKQNLFFEVEDYRIYLHLIHSMKSDYAFDLYHYCLMTNHTHLLIKFTTQEALQKVMQRVNLTYAKRYRKLNRYHGHIFQDRFKSFPIESESYLLECGRYIERNPLKAKMAASLEHYPWSSYTYYAHGESNPLITENPLYQELGGIPKERQARYRDYLSQDRPYENLIAEGLMKD